jgi:hydroxyacylglutathione hydrolase
MALQIDTFPCLSNNYGFLAHDPETGATATIDAADASPILQALERTGWSLSHILITHHHSDHTEGIPALKEATGAIAIGPAGEVNKIGTLDETVSPGETVELGSVTLDVISTPGHTLHHICYHDAEGGHVFVGDALFSLGCGRMFEGTPGPMWEGLTRLRALPDDTLVYCGHEYTQANARFALSIDPDNTALRQRAGEAEALRAANRPTIPFWLGVDKAANPFLRADAPELARILGLAGADPSEMFAAIRKAKDNF